MDRYTAATKRVLRSARNEALSLGHNYIGTEHLLLGILLEEGGVAKEALDQAGISREMVRAQVLERGKSADLGQKEIGYTVRAKMIVQRSNVLRNMLGDQEIYPYHLLGAILEEGQGLAARILDQLGFTMEDLQGVFYGQEARIQAQEAGQEEENRMEKYTRDLTALAQEDKLDPVIGREEEIERMVQILSRRTKNNPVIVGEAGVGKTALAEGLARRIIDRRVPELLHGKRVLSLDLGGLIAGTKFRGEFEERFKGLIEEVVDSGQVILFIDELHNLIGAGAAEGAVDAANILKPTLARGEIQCLGATTTEEYRKHIEKDAALERRFQMVRIEAPSVEETVLILEGLRSRYEEHHGIQISDGALRAAARLSDRYISDRFLPDKAIDVLDESAARLKLTRFEVPQALEDLEEKRADLLKEKEAAVENQLFEEAAGLRDELEALEASIGALEEDFKATKEDTSSRLAEEDIALTIAGWTKIPLSKIGESEGKKLLGLEDRLADQVVGQKAAVGAVAKAVRRSRAGLKDERRPVGSFIFLGPTGVGKTELARALARQLFDSEEAMIRLDMSEFMEKHTVSKLIGAPPGYVGYDEAGQLTEKVRRQPYSLLLFDEIEKAHPDVFNLLLQVLEDGRLTDGQGRLVSFSNTIIIMTSNVGASRIRREKTVGFMTDEGRGQSDKKDKMLDEMKKTFRPEFLNRVDEIVVFDHLSRAESRQIVGQMAKEILSRLEARDISFSLTDRMVDYLVDKGFDEEYGARPLRRLLQTELEDRLADGILEGRYGASDRLVFDLEEGQVQVHREKDALPVGS